MKRKIKYIFAFTILLVLGLLIYNNYSEEGIISGSDIKMLVATDIHYLATSLTEDSPEYKIFATPKDGRQLLYIDEILDAFIIK